MPVDRAPDIRFLGSEGERRSWEWWEEKEATDRAAESREPAAAAGLNTGGSDNAGWL